MRFSLCGLVAVSLPLAAAAAHAPRPGHAIAKRNETRPASDEVVHIFGPSPQLTVDPNTTPYCTYWIDNRGQETCEEVPDWWGISMQDFVRWNPSVTPDCGNFNVGQSYCVEAMGEPPVVTTTTKPTTTQPPTITTTTTAGNGVTTPSPIQPGMVSNCNRFYFVKTDDSCDAIARDHGISSASFLEWNPEVKSDCSGLWAEVNVCVGVIGFTPTTLPATTTSAGNGIATPTPIQPGMVGNCNAFHKVASGDQCDAIASRYGITRTQLTTWNPEIGSGCNSMWLDYYLCVGVVGVDPKPTTTTTNPGNGIATPTPIQPGMVSNCDAFHKVASGDQCDAIASRYGITRTQLTTWNPEIGSGCNSMWLEYYICVSVVGVDPKPTTTTNPGNGIATPTPIQPGMVGNCDAFHKVASGDQCDAIASRYGITRTQLTTWNPQIGSGCNSMWLDYYLCVSVVGVEPSKTTTTKATTTQGNGVTTPTPYQEGMTRNCRIFRKVVNGDSCESIARIAGISVSQFVSWNPAVGSSCSNLWLNTYACIGLL